MSQPHRPAPRQEINDTVASRWKILAAGIIALGIFLRLYHFLDNRSLWEDELFLASSLIRMDFHSLATLPLDYQQRAPLGFLWAVRLCVVLFGNHELPLRLFPLLCGIASLFAFAPVARHFLKPAGAAIALLILAVAPPLVYHSVEVKQYGTELLATILALLLYIKYHDRSDTASLVKWGTGGAVLVWFSFTALFVLAGIAAVVCGTHLLRKDRPALLRALLPFFLWGAGFGISYWFFVGNYADSGWLQDFWARRMAFFPLPPAFAGEAKWIVHFLYTFVYYPLGLTWFELDYAHSYSDVYRVLMRMPFLPLLLLLTGMVTLYRHNRQQFFILAAITAVSILASACRLYPLRERLAVFLAPVGILFIAHACDRLYALRRPAAYAVFVLLLAAPVVNSALQLADTGRFGSYKKSYQREAWLYLKAHYRPGDLVYIYWNDLPGWRYYSQAYHLQFNALEGSDVRQAANSFPDYYRKLAPDFDTFRKYSRVWVVYRNYNGMKVGDYEGQPAWYYKDVNAAGRLREHLLTKGVEKRIFQPGHYAWADIYVGLFYINTH